MKKDIHIITPAKVGSRTLYDYIEKEKKNSTIVENVYHNHSLLNLKNIVNSQKNKVIIVGVRNPIERNFSYILKNHLIPYCSKSCPWPAGGGVLTKKNNYKGDLTCYIPHYFTDNEFIEAYFKVDSDEGIWNSGAETMIDGGPNIGQRPGYKGGYFPAAPIDTMHGIRGEMVRIMVDQLGFHVEKHHHEVATGGQGEIDLKYDTMLSMADKVMQYKYVVKNVAQAYGK